MAINDFKAAASDLDDAVTAEPQNLQAWTTRAFAYERLGDKEKAAGSYARALNLDQNNEFGKAGLRPCRRQVRTKLPDVLSAGGRTTKPAPTQDPPRPLSG